MADDSLPISKGIIIKAASLIDISPNSSFNFKISILSLKIGEYTFDAFF